MNISNIIEEFIIDTIGEDMMLQLSRNDLANYFNCAPSQINYVLSTRFTPQRGYVCESKRGSGGFVTVIRLKDDKEPLLISILKDIDDSDYFTFNKATSILNRLERDNIITDGEIKLIASAISDKALSLPIDVNSKLRKQIFKEVIYEILKRD